MILGMLWFDNDQKSTLDEKVIKAAIYYGHKYGRAANRCMVNPAMVEVQPDQEYQVGEIKIIPNRSIMLNHFWLYFDQPVQLAQSNQQLSFLEA